MVQPSEHSIFTFSTRHLPQSAKVRFFYALKGRGAREGLVSRVRAEHLGPGVLLVPGERAGEVASFLEYWKCPVTRREVTLKG